MTGSRLAPAVRSKPLRKLLSELPGLLTWPPPNVHVTGICDDSRHVQQGNLFVARVGDTFDGHVFIRDAVMSGAAAVVGERPAADFLAPVPYLRVRNGHEALAWLSAAWHGFPARHLTMIGVTGTDGKTTTVNLLYQILRAADVKVSMISTVNAIIGDETYDTGLHVTTPDAPDVQRYLAQMIDAGASHAILEATSHGLAQHRVTACDFDVAIITNVTHEHLDYHGDWEAYLAAKVRLFEGLLTAVHKPRRSKFAVLNADDASLEALLDVGVEKIVSYGFADEADVSAHNTQYSPYDTCFDVHVRLPGDRQKEFPISTSLPGAHNVSNVLAAVAAALGLGMTPETIQAGVAATKGIAGRMERITDDGQPVLGIVDFAHTPNALRRTLETARTLTRDNGRVIAIWGSAGLRDREKRRLMGTISAQLADITIITAEDPRTESLEALMMESATACEKEGRREGVDFWQVADRGQALRFAVELARPGDVVIACGKGHEQSMCFGTTEYPWDDREALRRAFRGETLDTLPTAKVSKPPRAPAGP